VQPGYPDAMNATPSRSSPLIGWRMLALLYDLFPVFGLWFLVAAIFVAVHRDAVLGGGLGMLEFALMWLVTGAYAVISWRRGGHTLGMRPWRLRVTAADGGCASITALAWHYAMGTVSLLLMGAGFWWAWVDKDGLAWHDRISATRVQREMDR
jgi:uncharacterized RDD family membrane protein YckC